MAEDGLMARVPRRRRYSSYEGETTPAPDNLADRDFTAGCSNEKWPADITRNQGQGWGRACLSPMIDCYDGRIIAYTAGFNPNTEPCRQDARQGRGDTAGGSKALGALGLRMSLPAVRPAPSFRLSHREMPARLSPRKRPQLFWSVFWFEML